MSKTSRKSVSKAVPPKKMVSKPKPTAAPKKASVTKKKTPTVPKKRVTKAKTPAVTKSTTVKKAATTTKKKSTTTTTKRQTKASVTKAAKKTTTRKTTASVVKVRRKPSVPQATDVATSDPATVVLPTRMSIRAREKALVIADAFEKDFYRIGVTLTKVGALCFLLLGSLATFSQLQQLIPIDVCTDVSCQGAQVSSALNQTPGTTEQTLATDQNYVELLATLPSTMAERTSLPIEVSNAGNVQAYVTYLTSDGRNETRLSVINLGNNKHELVIDPAVLPNAQYELIVDAQHTNMTQRRTYSLGYFSVVARSTNTQPVTPTTDPLDASEVVSDAATTTSTTPTATSTRTNTLPLSTTPALADEETPQRETTVTSQPETESIIPTVDSTPEPEPVLPVVETAPSDQPFVINAARTISGTASVAIPSASSYSSVVFYIRKSQGLNSQNIGNLIRGTETFRFDTRQFPNGEYELYAQGRIGTTLKFSNTVRMTIDNPVSVTRTTDVSASQERELLTVSNELADTQLPVTQDSDETSTSSSVTTQELTIMERVRTNLALDADTLDELFKRYAIAQQSGDPATIAKAEAAITAYREQVTAAALGDERDRFIARELDAALGSELSRLQERVRTFEAVRRERTEGDSSVDTDGDGISDFDELTLYKTDPTRADTDNDGFTDGAEVMRGYNPNDATAEAVILYESPKEAVGVTITDKLQVTDVLPEIELAAEDKPQVVRAVVRGVGLPNSFVTLYVFSTPTIVTVRTEADGSFAYTFSKELEDGEHQVFVALTDNTGAIVAQSEPFTFVKRAEAFTPVDAAEVAAGVSPLDATNQAAPYRLVLGMSVFALGILLILLGVGLNGNRPDDIVVEQQSI